MSLWCGKRVKACNEFHFQHHRQTEQQYVYKYQYWQSGNSNNTKHCVEIDQSFAHCKFDNEAWKHSSVNKYLSFSLTPLITSETWNSNSTQTHLKWAIKWKRCHTFFSHLSLRCDASFSRNVFSVSVYTTASPFQNFLGASSTFYTINA